jgi:uncharacterized SAM-dependent methyltransferase
LTSLVWYYVRMTLNRRQESELITAIRGRGEIPLKFSYIGEGADNWNRVAGYRQNSDGINNIEEQLLRRRARDFIDAFGPSETINVIDIGCGNGVPGTPIFEELVKQKKQFRYVPIDISAEMLELAQKYFLDRFPWVEVSPILLDFELGNFADLTYGLRDGKSANLLLFLGSTLGNHADRGRVLANFRDSMSADDFLIIGVELSNFAKMAKVLRYYEEENAKRFVYHTAEQIGITQAETRFEVEWNDREHQVELRAVPKHDIEIAIGEERFTVEKDEPILIARSVKFTEWSVAKTLSDVGFRNEILTTNAARSYLLSMVQPTR